MLLNETLDPPILKSFMIHGLNGYKTISLTFDHSAKIVAAENGSGKTTFLNALYAVLTGQLHRLLSLDFYSIDVQLTGAEPLTFTKEDLSLNVSDAINTSKNVNWLLENGLESQMLQSASEKFSLLPRSEFAETEEYYAVYLNGPLDHPDTYEKFSNAFNDGLMLSENIREVTSSITAALKDVQVMYLPTYRRIETEQPGSSAPKQRVLSRGLLHNRRKRSDWDERKLMNFGLNDVEQKLENMTFDIKQRTARAYSKISGETLDQLIETGEIDKSLGDDLNIQNLNVILARLGKSEAHQRLGQLIESGEIQNSQNRHLKSFLGQMLEIYKETEAQELAIQRFVDIMNSYWERSAEKKHFEFDKLAVETRVINSFTKSELSLNNLSSGEKQIISIFARLYLDPTVKYLILIDEPELSLSIDWQRKLLPDMFNSPSCRQLVAITHSPFIFENDLDDFAGPLIVNYKPQAK